jgi:hypothetical protein
MNAFHEINMMTSRGDILGAFSLIRDRSESVARKIMKKAGYSVPVYTGRAFWAWVQETLLTSSRQCRNGYQVRAERNTPTRGFRQQVQEDYEAWAQMMSQPVHEEDTKSYGSTTAGPAEQESNVTGVSTHPFRDEQIKVCNMTVPLNIKNTSTPVMSSCIEKSNHCRQDKEDSHKKLHGTGSAIYIHVIHFFCYSHYISLLRMMRGINVQSAVYFYLLLLYDIIYYLRDRYTG